MFDATRHEPCTTTSWQLDAVDAAIRESFGASQDCLSKKYWRKPDENDAPTSLYEGASGVLWAVSQVSASYGESAAIDLVTTAEEIFADYAKFEAKAFSGKFENFEASYFLGHSGQLNVLQRLIPNRYHEFQRSIIHLAKLNITNPTLEILWGGPGSILPVVNNLEDASESGSDINELHSVFIRQLEYLRSQLTFAMEYDCQFWTQDLYGQLRWLTGAGHGFVGNVYPFLRGQAFLADTDRQWLHELTVDTVIKTATVSDQLANWQKGLDMQPSSDGYFLLQWCHGAPGIILAVNDIPYGYSTEFDSVLLKAGETIWQAGPLKKGLGLCHGTDGNGYAFLKLFQRTGDQLWLDRARAFAMHGIEQNQNRPGAWVGDSILPLYLLACQYGTSKIPLWDYV